MTELVTEPTSTPATGFDALVDPEHRLLPEQRHLAASEARLRYLMAAQECDSAITRAQQAAVIRDLREQLQLPRRAES